MSICSATYIGGTGVYQYDRVWQHIQYHKSHMYLYLGLAVFTSLYTVFSESISRISNTIYRYSPFNAYVPRVVCILSLNCFYATYQVSQTPLVYVHVYQGLLIPYHYTVITQHIKYHRYLLFTCMCIKGYWYFITTLLSHNISSITDTSYSRAFVSRAIDTLSLHCYHTTYQVSQTPLILILL